MKKRYQIVFASLAVRAFEATEEDAKKEAREAEELSPGVRLLEMTADNGGVEVSFK